MRINIFGLGYVGCVSAACLAREGHEVTGLDINTTKVELVSAGKSPIVEAGLDEALQDAVKAGRLEARENNIRELNDAQLSIICVGTPSNENGSLNVDYIKRVVRQIGQALQQTQAYHVVCVRSTVLPGTVEDVLIPILERYSGKKAGEHFGVCMNPEFLREGSSLKDFYDPPFTLIGQLDSRSGDLVARLYKGVDPSPIRSSIRTAEMVKYACNAFHALKVSFANEIGNICKPLAIDSHEVMSVFCRDTRLNLSPYYLKPGFAFGGSCLPKDVRALLYQARSLDLDTPLLSSVLPSNDRQIDIAFNLVRKTGRRRVGFLGLSFKAGTDDLRESPLVELIERLIGKGYKIQIHDREVSVAKLMGSNKQYIEKAIPHVSQLVKNSAIDVVAACDVVVVGNNTPEYAELVNNIQPGKVIIDLVRIMEKTRNGNGRYEGICW